MASAGGASSGNAAGNPSAGGDAASGLSFSRGGDANSSEARGQNWALRNASRGSVPIRRPIQVVVREKQIAVLPSRHVKDGAASSGFAVSLDQSADDVVEEFVAGVQQHIEEWGLAGRGLYWKPVLMFNVAPGADGNAARLSHLLRDSGVEVRIPDTAQRKEGRPAHATR